MMATLKTALVLAVGLIFLSVTSAGAKAPDTSAGTYKQNCTRCHGETGRGDGPAVKLLKVKPTDMTDKAYMSRLTDADMYKLIEKGGTAIGKSKLMPAYEGKLKKNEIEDLVRYIRGLSER